jgi:hypothetical protein
MIAMRHLADAIFEIDRADFDVVMRPTACILSASLPPDMMSQW